MGKIKDITGQHFNGLFALRFVRLEPKGKYREAVWSFLCICGRTVERRATSVRLGNTKSCGCLRKSSFGIHRFKLPKGQAALHKVYVRYRRRATEKSILFVLTVDQFKCIAEGNCWYCGAQPSLEVNNGHQLFNGSWRHNTVDRRNNVEGYVLGNCVPACWTCNKMKGTNTETEFRAACARVAYFNR